MEDDKKPPPVNQTILRFAQFCGYAVSEDEPMEALIQRVMAEKNISKDQAEALILAGHQEGVDNFFTKSFGKKVPMKYFLIVRNANKENLSVLEFETPEEQDAHRAQLKAEGHEGELVRAHATSLRELFDVFIEYRPKNWRELLATSDIKKS